MRIIAVIIILLGLASVVLGILFFPQANSGEKEIADSVIPLTLDQVSDKYDAVSMLFNAQMAKEEPQIQAGKAMPSDMYNYLSAQRALLGLAKANMGTIKATRTNGVIDIIAGVGLVLTGFVILRKFSS